MSEKTTTTSTIALWRLGSLSSAPDTAKRLTPVKIQSLHDFGRDSLLAALKGIYRSNGFTYTGANLIEYFDDVSQYEAAARAANANLAAITCTDIRPGEVANLREGLRDTVDSLVETTRMRLGITAFGPLCAQDHPLEEARISAFGALYIPTGAMVLEDALHALHLTAPVPA